jgi:hypothetical protein
VSAKGKVDEASETAYSWGTSIPALVWTQRSEVGIKVTLSVFIDTEVFDIQEYRGVESAAAEANLRVYSWKTIGRSNWLERGVSISDVLGLVVLPDGLPEYVEMPDDVLEPGVDNEVDVASR